MASNVKAVPGGVAALQDIMDRAFEMGRHAKKKKAQAQKKTAKRGGRKVAWPTGRTILAVRWMTDAELEREGWDSGVAIDLNDGGILFASRDDEGNAAGVFFAISPKGEAVRVHPVT